MSIKAPAPDRRVTNKARHRQSIIDAASLLMRERLSRNFSVDDLAAQAEVSRRTIFNHFASIDDVVIEVFGNELGTVVERLITITASADGQHLSMFDELAETLRSTDLVTPMVYLTQILGSEDPEPSPREALLAARSFTEISDRLREEMLSKHPDVDALTISLLASSLTGGLFIIYGQWERSCGAIDTVESRRQWDHLIERLLASLRNGYGHDHQPPIFS